LQPRHNRRSQNFQNPTLGVLNAEFGRSIVRFEMLENSR
jgi:hypothetical protein